MKNYVLTLITFFVSIGLWAQMPALPDLLQEKFDQEQLDLTLDYDDSVMDLSEEQYYQKINRSGGNDTLLGFIWNREMQEWKLRARIIKVYNDNEKVTDKYFQIIGRNGEWVNGLYFKYTYNDGGLLLKLLIQHWGPDANEWVNYFRKQNNYNDAGKLSLVKTQWWSRPHGEWIDRHLKKLAWNGDFLIADTVKMHRPGTDRWINHHYDRYNFTDSGIKISRVLFLWHPDGHIWVKTKRFNYNYNDNGTLLISVVCQFWRGEDAGWKNLNQHKFSYFDNGNLRGCIFEDWNEFHAIWIEKFKIEYVYNDAGRIGQIVKKTKKHPDENWKNAARALFNYDDMGNMTQKITQEWNRFHEIWVNLRKWEMILQYQSIAGLGEDVGNNIKATFRNPYRSGKTIAFSGLEEKVYTLQLFDQIGRVVESDEIFGNGVTGFNIAVSNGVYILILSENNKPVYSTKLVVAE